MSDLASPSLSAQTSPRLSLFNILSDFSIVAVHLVAVVAVVDWVAGSLLGGSITAYTVSSVVLGIPTLVACYIIMRLAIRAERNRASGKEPLSD